ncbi:MAG: hypothetical protein M3Q75_12150 [Gemmatimonadota bacterium]|nr:hypothetical protein [Gemmatimonadota bacterium]
MRSGTRLLRVYICAYRSTSCASISQIQPDAAQRAALDQAAHVGLAVAQTLRSLGD